MKERCFLPQIFAICRCSCIKPQSRWKNSYFLRLFSVIQNNKKQENIVVQWSNFICWWFEKYIWCLKWHLKRLNDCFFITNQHRCKKTYILFIHLFGKKRCTRFLIFHSNKKIIMPMESVHLKVAFWNSIIVCIVVSTHPQKHPPPLFLAKPPIKSANCPSPPLLGQSHPIYWFFVNTP